MAVIKGFGGSVVLPGSVNISVREWRARFEVDEATIAASFGEAWEQAGLGAGRVTGSLNGRIDTGARPFNPPTDNATAWSNFEGTVNLKATTSTLATLSGTMIFKSFEVTRQHSGGCEVTCEFRNAGTDASVGTWAS